MEVFYTAHFVSFLLRIPSGRCSPSVSGSPPAAPSTSCATTSSTTSPSSAACGARTTTTTRVSRLNQKQCGKSQSGKMWKKGKTGGFRNLRQLQGYEPKLTEKGERGRRKKNVRRGIGTEFFVRNPGRVREFYSNFLGRCSLSLKVTQPLVRSLEIISC